MHQILESLLGDSSLRERERGMIMVWSLSTTALLASALPTTTASENDPDVDDFLPLRVDQSWEETSWLASYTQTKKGDGKVG